MRALRIASCLGASALCLAACQAPGASPPATSPIGLSGGPLTDALSVVVVDDATGREIGGATVTCGDAPHTTALGAAVRCEAASVGDGVVVRASGYVTERWIGISEAHAVVAMRARAAPGRALHGAITGATDRASIGVSSELGILRSGDVTGGAAACVDASDCNVALSASVAAEHDAAVLDHGGARLVLVRDVPIDAAGEFAIDVLAATESEPLIELTVTLPGAAGLTEVVGVPGLSTENGVALLGSLAEGTSTLAPAREGALAGDRLWFVARARTADGTGESFALDRDVPVGGTAVELPSTFLAVPVASRTGDVVALPASSEPVLYVIESSDDTGVVEHAVVFGAAEGREIPVTGSSVRVRAIDTVPSGAVDLDAVAATATRFADRVL